MLADQIKTRAGELGFTLCAIAPADPSRYRDYFRNWIDSGQHGEMHYLARRFEERIDPSAYLPGARSIICVALNYHTPLDRPDEADQGRIARYALGDDYHEIVKPRLHQLADWLRNLVPGIQTRVAVDTAPVMEKELAARAGIGWLGKNTCIINELIGSWVFLGEVLTTLELPPDAPAADRCGSCTRCIDACPTQAITAPYQLDARRCISYQTIENRGEVNLPITPWLYGCDICQEVCPWNGRAPDQSDDALAPRFPSGSLPLDEILKWNEETYRSQLRQSAMKRVKLPMLQRNARLLGQREGPRPKAQS